MSLSLQKRGEKFPCIAIATQSRNQNAGPQVSGGAEKKIPTRHGKVFVYQYDLRTIASIGYQRWFQTFSPTRHSPVTLSYRELV
ncbi:MAG: hypothetical protein HQL07_04045 [Nitrospirae bacterium]|nr:hypothetical protein [Magnetococcales bacterium]